MADVQIRQVCDQADIPRVLDMLCRSFDQDPHINWMLRQDGQRSQAMRALFRLLLDPSRGGELHVTHELHAAALWFSPAGADAGLSRDLAFFVRYPRIAGWTAAVAKALNLKRLQSLRPNEPHYYLQLLGVDPGSQRHGLGSRLLLELTTRCDREGVPAYLETSREDNAAFYARQGFQVVARTRLSEACTLLSMLRAPHGHRTHEPHL